MIIALLAATTDQPTQPLVADPEPATVPYLHVGSPPYGAPVPMDLTNVFPHNGGGMVHPTVVDFGASGWNGHRYWACMNDYGQGTGAATESGAEDPYIFVSADGYNWAEPAGMPQNPISTIATQDELHDGPYGGINTDPEFIYDPDTDTLHLWWREYMGATAQTRLWHSSSTTGAIWETPEIDTSWPLDWIGVSPGAVRVTASDWRMWTFSRSEAGLRVKTATSPDGPWSEATSCTGPDSIRRGWHGDVILHGGRFWLIADGYVSSSLDGINWVGSNCALGQDSDGWMDTPTIYRATLTPTTDGHMRIWYTRDASAKNGGWPWLGGYAVIPQSFWPDPT